MATFRKDLELLSPEEGDGLWALSLSEKQTKEMDEKMDERHKRIWGDNLKISGKRQRRADKTCCWLYEVSNEWKKDGVGFDWP